MKNSMLLLAALTVVLAVGATGTLKTYAHMRQQEKAAPAAPPKVEAPTPKPFNEPAKPAAAAPEHKAAAELEPPTDKEELTVRRSQVYLQNLKDQKAQYDTYMDRQIAEATQDLSQKVQTIYTAHKAKQPEDQLCDGPTPGPCEKAPPHELTWGKTTKK